MRYLIPALISMLCILGASLAFADSPKIVDAQMSKSGMFWRLDVTIQHPDTGWDHYADAWRVTDAKGKVLGELELHHPHVDEQPFTRSLSNVLIPDGSSEVFVEAKCSKNGWGKQRFRVPVK